MKEFFNKKLIVCFILIVIILAFVFIYNYMAKQEKINNKKRTDHYLNLIGFGVFFEKSNGKISSSTVSKFLNENVTKYLPAMYGKVKNLNEKKLRKYFENNRNDIKDNLGITTFEDFSSFVQKLKDKKVNLSTGEKLEIIKDSFKIDSDKAEYSYVEYEVTYLNEKKILFSVYIEKDSDDVPFFIINVIE